MAGNINLNLDYEVASATLATLVATSVNTFGAHLCVDNIDLQKVSFQNYDVKDKAKLLQEINQDIAAAQEHVESWEDNLNPSISTVAQGFVNYASTFAATLTQLRGITKKPAGQKTADSLRLLFQGLIDKLDEQATNLLNFKQKMVNAKRVADNDASNVSNKNKAFSSLEKIDKKNLADAKKKLKAVSDKLKEHSTEITNKAILNHSKIDVAAIVLSVDHLTEYTAALGLAIDTGFIIKDGLELQDLIWVLDEAFQEAMKQQQYQFEVSQLNEQLLGLDAASNAIQRFATHLDSMITAMEAVNQQWVQIRAPLQAFLDTLNDSDPLKNVPGDYMLGRASAEWEIMLAFSEQMQRISFDTAKKKRLVNKTKPKVAA